MGNGMSKPLLALLLSLAVVLAAACDEDKTPTSASSAPASLKYISGSEQSGLQLTTLAQPLVVQVLDYDGDPVAAHQVVFEVVSLNGTLAGNGLETQTVFTNANGMTSVYLVLGDSVGIDSVEASAVDASNQSLNGSPVLFTATVDSSSTGGGGTTTPGDTTSQDLEPTLPEPDRIDLVSGGGQTGEVSSILPLPLAVRVYNDANSPLAGVDVIFTVTQGFGIINKEGSLPQYNMIIITTDESGVAAVTYMLGPGPDLDNQVVAEIRRIDGTQDSVVFYAEAQPQSDMANSLVIMSGDDQGPYVVNSMLPLPLVVGVFDSRRTDLNPLGMPIPNFPVLFQAFSPSGDASVLAQESDGPGGTGRLTATTDEDGLAAVRLTVGTRTGAPDDSDLWADNNHVVAVAVYADGTQDSVLFYATAMPGAPANIVEASGTDLSGIAGESLAGISVIVTDSYDNSNAGVPVGFVIDESPGGGSLSQSSVSTDIYGYATSGLSRLSTTIGTMTVSAVNGELSGSPVTFTITVLPDEADRILKAGGDNQQGTVGTAFSSGVKVMILDQYNNPRGGDLVTFTVTGGSASLSDMIKATGSDGTAETTVTPYSTSVTISAGAVIQGVTRTVTFSLTAEEESE